MKHQLSKNVSLVHVQFPIPRMNISAKWIVSNIYLIIHFLVYPSYFANSDKVSSVKENEKRKSHETYMQSTIQSMLLIFSLFAINSLIPEKYYHWISNWYFYHPFECIGQIQRSVDNRTRRHNTSRPKREIISLIYWILILDIRQLSYSNMRIISIINVFLKQI